MHELSVVMEVITCVEQALDDQPGRRIRRLDLRIGALSGVERELFEDCLGVAVENTALEDAELVIEDVPVEVDCLDCGQVTQPTPPLLECAVCGAANTTVVSGRDLVVHSMEVY